MIIGTAGHIDHGKTSLVRALTGTDTDRLKEEKARGITIDLGFAYLPGPDGEVLGFVDVPGHERFVHTMVAGASGIDFVLLVVAADDGPMPQTAEHLAIIDLLGVSQGAVALTKVDLVGPERLDAVEAELREMLAPTGLADLPILPLSTVTGSGVERLRAHLFAAAEGSALRSAAGLFRLAIDRSFTLAEAGTVVTGTVLSGAVATGDRVTVSPRGVSARVRSIHAQNRPAATGRRTALRAQPRRRGRLEGGGRAWRRRRRSPAPRDHRQDRRRARRAAERGKGDRGLVPVRLHHASAELAARLVPLGSEPIRPGARGPVQLVLERPIAAAAGDRFVVRDTSARRTIGGGRFLDLRAPARKRRTPERLAQLAAHGRRDPAEAVAALLAVAPRYLDLDTFVRDRALAPDAASAIVSDLRLTRLTSGEASVVLTLQTWADLREQVLAALAGFHAEHPDLQGLGLERLRMALPLRLPVAFFRTALANLAADGDISVAGSWAHLPGHVVQLSAAQDGMWSDIAPQLAGAERFRPPRVRDLAGVLSAAEPEVRRLLKLIGRRGDVDEVAQDHFFRRDAVIEMAGIVRSLSAKAPDGFFTAAQFRDKVENGRKVAIQILDFFDRAGVTLRRGDLRRVNRHRLDVFAAEALGTDKVGLDEPDGGRVVSGEASGLQIREGLRDSLWWVRLPLSLAKLADLDPDQPTWQTPASRMKLRLQHKDDAARDHLVPLSRQAVEALGALTGRGPYVMPNGRSAHRPMSENALGNLLNRAGYHHRHVPHGWRSAFSTVMNEGFPADRAIIDLMLAHVPKDNVEAASNRAAHMERRRLEVMRALRRCCSAR